MLTYWTPICLAKVRSSSLKSLGIWSEILIPGVSGSSGRLAAPARDRKAAPPNKVRANSRRLLIEAFTP